MRNYKDPLTYALYLIELRDRSEGEIQDRMQRKGFDAKEIAKTISFLKSKKFLDDKKFAQMFVREKRDLQHWGEYRIKVELRKHFVSEEIIEEILSNQSDQSETAIAHEAAASWRRKNKNCPREKIYSRLGGYLSRQGFSYDIVKEILDKM